MDDAFVQYCTDQALALQGQESNELPALRRQLADTEKAIDNMLNAIQAGIFNASTKRRLDELEATKEKLELSIIEEEMKKTQFTREQIQFYILQFRKVDTNTLEGRRRLIDGFVNSVVVYDDYILVTFNYKESAERITFEQIERSDLSSFGGGGDGENRRPGQEHPLLHQHPRDAGDVHQDRAGRGRPEIKREEKGAGAPFSHITKE